MQGGDGNDTVSYISSDAGVKVDLSKQSVSGGDADGDLISSMENVAGTRFNDVLIGTNGDNVLDGYTGEFDEINGLSGVDTAVIQVDYFHVVKANPLKLTILKADHKIAFDHYNHTGELESIELIKYQDDAGDYELDVKKAWAVLASDEQDKFNDEADFLSWLGNDAGYNYEGL